ncbi:hypothetical protein Ahy_A01g003418 [Arachis hypogaea]|uniref:Aminotransferase-like plant mobile domain-containing protein n=1 Tax=Arachis hypogaea TaxID=3818 RepID=A0A445ESU8_ARAHY|nr:hypothetical protein Ahy_A01g003418 [Arachis hypogaea]
MVARHFGSCAQTEFDDTAAGRLESHVFHLPYEEITITLHDVVYQVGLRIDGEPTATDQVDCETHLVPQHDLQRVGVGRHRGTPVEVHERIHHAVDRGYPIFRCI